MESAEELYDGEETAKPEEPVTVDETPTGDTSTDEPASEVNDDQTPASDDDNNDAPSPGADEEPKLDHPALLGERRRRQAAEEELRELKSQQQEPDKELDPIDPFSDDFNTQLTERERALEKRFQDQLLDVRLDMSERAARKIHGDEVVDEAITWFKEEGPKSPLLLQRFQQSQDVEDIVDLHQTHLKAAKLENLDEVEAEIEARVRAEIEAEMKEKANKDTALKDSIPTSLVDEPSKGKLSGSDWGGPPSAEELYGE